jgi:hypothetical protein
MSERDEFRVRIEPGPFKQEQITVTLDTDDWKYELRELVPPQVIDSDFLPLIIVNMKEELRLNQAIRELDDGSKEK